jgi:hypothetical protein
MLHRASAAGIACITIALRRSDIEFFGLAHSQALVVLYQIYFALDLGALESVMVMFTSLRVAYRGEPQSQWPIQPDEPGGGETAVSGGCRDTVSAEVIAFGEKNSDSEVRSK